jgi:hypothetical protein
MSFQSTPVTVVATIAAGAAISAPVAISGRLVGIGMPSTWTDAVLTFDVSSNGGATYQQATRDGNEFTAPVEAGDMPRFDPAFWGGITNIKVRSGTKDASVNQAASADISLIIEPYS